MIEYAFGSLQVSFIPLWMLALEAITRIWAQQSRHELMKIHPFPLISGRKDFVSFQGRKSYWRIAWVCLNFTIQFPGIYEFWDNPISYFFYNLLIPIISPVTIWFHNLIQTNNYMSFVYFVLDACLQSVRSPYHVTLNWLVVWLPSILFSHIYWVNVIIPIDELIFFRGVALQPPTSHGNTSMIPRVFFPAVTCR